jgi:3-ketosteroid 9alpha-monooxygenase subunit A
MYFYTEQSYPEFSFKSWWVNYYTPINSSEVDLCAAVILKQGDERPIPDKFRELYPEIAHAAFGQDAEIWETKVYQPDPILCDGDGPINKLRKWYEQFYLPK